MTAMALNLLKAVVIMNNTIIETCNTTKYERIALMNIIYQFIIFIALSLKQIYLNELSYI